MQFTIWYKMRFLPFIFTICLFVLFYFKRFFVIKFYPPIMNLIIFLIFFTSLFAQETIIQKFAKMWSKKPLHQLELTYTKKLTYVWCVFLFLNFIISIITIFLDDKIWMFYNCFLSYFFIGLIFIIEYIVRLAFRKRHNL